MISIVTKMRKNSYTIRQKKARKNLKPARDEVVLMEKDRKIIYYDFTKGHHVQ